MANTPDPLFAGATRPTMLWGVSMEAVIFNFMFTSIAFIGSKSIFLLLACIPIHAVSYLVCMKDPRAFRFIYLWLVTKGRAVSRAYWGASSATPLGNTRNQKVK